MAEYTTVLAEFSVLHLLSLPNSTSMSNSSIYFVQHGLCHKLTIPITSLPSCIRSASLKAYERKTESSRKWSGLSSVYAHAALLSLDWPGPVTDRVTMLTSSDNLVWEGD